MSSPRRRRTALAVTGLAAAALATVATVPAVSPHPIAHVSEGDALFLPAATTVPALAATFAPARAVRTAALTAASYKFSSTLDGAPVRWNPCQPLHWRSNTALGPVGGLTVLRAAVAHIAAQTGTTWVYDGSTSAVPNTAYLPQTPTYANKPVLLGWTTGAASDLLRGRPAQVLGMTRTVWFGVDDGMGHRAAATRGAVVALQANDRLPLRGPQSWSATALHELGHVMGLDHPQDPSQLMAAVLPAASTYQNGDIRGLSLLGRSAGCVVVPGA